MIGRSKRMIGWKEWCYFPDLGLPAIQAKIDTGAKTSSIHAVDIEPFVKNKKEYVRFTVQPIQKDPLKIECIAPLVDYRYVTSSNGEKERRYVIKTKIGIGDHEIEAEVTLTSRHKMTFRMLLGRDTICKAKLTVDPVKSYILGKVSDPERLYKANKRKKSK